MTADPFGSSGRAQVGQDFRGGCALSDAARMEAEARSAILRWGYGRFVDELARVSADAVGGPWTEGQAVRPELNEVLEFLYGAEQMDGVWWGEGPPEGKPRYWWRSKLRNAIKTFRDPQATLTPTRDPQPLTDAQIDAIFFEHHSVRENPWVNWRRFARAIE